MREKLSLRLKDIILGGQDGLVNVLGLVLGVAGATYDTRIIIISGLAGTFAESISMGAVAYTSSKAARDYYLSRIKNSKKKLFHEIDVIDGEYKSPVKNGFVVGISAIVGSLIPLIPFFFLSVTNGIYSSFAVSFASLFFIGALKAKLTIGDWRKSGLEMGLIGIGAAIAAYYIGKLIGVVF